MSLLYKIYCWAIILMISLITMFIFVRFTINDDYWTHIHARMMLTVVDDHPSYSELLSDLTRIDHALKKNVPREWEIIDYNQYPTLLNLSLRVDNSLIYQEVLIEEIMD